MEIKLLKNNVNSASDKNPPHGKNPSNKGINIKLDTNLIAKSYNKHGIYILKPIIDRLALRYDPPKGWHDKKTAAFKTFVYSYVSGGIKSDDWDYEYVPNEEQAKNNSLYRAYKKNLWLKHKPSGENILVQTDPKKVGTPFFRFDLNPSRLGVDGIKFFKEELDFLFCKGDFDIGYGDVLKSPNAVYRLDVAVDILGVDVSDLELTYHSHANQKQQIKAMQYLSTTGRIQTDYPNAKLKGENKTYVYNKKYELQDKGQDTYYDEAMHARFEHRYLKWNKPLDHLLKIGVGTNPLKKLSIKWIDYRQIKEKSFEHVLFLQYARNRGIKKALEIIPEHKQMDFIDTYKKAMTDIWNSSELWKHWPYMVNYYGLLEE